MGFDILDESTRPKAVGHGRLANSYIRPKADFRSIGFNAN